MSINIYLFTWYFITNTSTNRLEDRCLLMPFYFNVCQDMIHENRITFIDVRYSQQIIYEVKQFQIQTDIFYAIWIRNNVIFSDSLGTMVDQMQFDSADIQTWDLYQKYNYETAVVYNSSVLKEFYEWYNEELFYNMKDFLMLSSYYNRK